MQRWFLLIFFLVPLVSLSAGILAQGAPTQAAPGRAVAADTPAVPPVKTEAPVIVNEHLVLKLGLYAVWAIAIIFIHLTTVGVLALCKMGDKSNTFFQTFLETGNALRMLTVVLIVVAATVLSLLGIIHESGIVGILSGVAGYVLGSLDKHKTEKPPLSGKKLPETSLESAE